MLLCVSCHELAHAVRAGILIPAGLLKLQPACRAAWWPSPPNNWQAPAPPPSQHPHNLQPLLCALQAAEKLKRQVSQELGVPLLPPLPAMNAQQPGGEAAAEGAAAEAAAGGAGVPAADLHPYNVRKSALAYQRYGRQMPEQKRQ